ncbi:MAG: 50S ribosomal protein L2 [Candidatus ainarchaeum sp.]|jgi:large subunit ribosomal protein L2|nr:50S ribosomal protein L2 [Candidatus ainarchaeum sp.]MDD3085773.1 50S ribosomal protein L2 [Candidatus ainarchaeum sp.]MDD4128506.1 50S ribosomal protein L2 [Candidatus ainarchaeum sp.]HPM85869.1 50S ribosomal protein L2 [archaeon]
MGKRLISQRSGRGTHTFIAKHKGIQARYCLLNDELLNGEVTDLIKDTGRHAIIAEIIFTNGVTEYLPAAEGLYLGKKIQQGAGAQISIGNVSYLSDLPEGCPVYNVEKILGDGGTLIKSAGAYALLMAKDKKKATLKMPSGKMINLPLTCRATIGNISCGGKGDKPFVKAGNMFHLMKAKHKMYPRVRGVKMNAVDHPFGGAAHHPGKSKSTSRNAPPGRKVGAIGSTRTGRRKKN